MFKSLVIYVVEPTGALAALCATNKGLWECLSETMVWTDEEGGQAMMTEKQRLTRFKILVFAFFLGEFKSLQQIMGNPQLDERTFDQYWKVRRIEPEGSVRQLCFESGKVIQSQFGSTGDGDLDKWIKTDLS